MREQDTKVEETEAEEERAARQLHLLTIEGNRQDLYLSLSLSLYLSVFSLAPHSSLSRIDG